MLNQDERKEVIRIVETLLTNHEINLHPYQPLTISGGDLQDAKPDTNMTTPTPEMVTTATSNLVQPLGEVLEEVDSLITTLTRYRNLLQFAYSNVLGGDNGPSVLGY